MSSNYSPPKNPDLLKAFLAGFAIGAIFVILAVMTPACVTTGKLYPRLELIDQILKPRPGHEGKLTNRTCFEYEGESCKTEHMEEYDLSDGALRQKLNDLRFVCDIGGRHFKVCLDKPGFCHFSSQKKCFLFFCHNAPLEEEFLPVSNYQFLLDAKTRCYNKEVYPFGGSY